MRYGTGILLLLALAALPVFPTPGRMPERANRVANGDFSQVVGGKPAQWETSGDPRHVAQALDIVRERGNTVARLRCTRFEGEGGFIHAMLAQVGVVRLEKGLTYAFTCRARAEDLPGQSVQVAITDTSAWEGCGLSQSLALGRAWRSYRFLFRATRSVEATSRLQFWFASTGTLYLDDVRIEEVAPQQVVFTSVVLPAGGRNLVPNGSFDAGPTGWASLGISTGWGNLAGLHGAVIASGDPAHRRCLRIPMGDGRTPILYFDYLRPVVQPQTTLLAASEGWIPIEPDKPYTLSCAMRASEEGTGAVLGVIAADPGEASWMQRALRRSVRLTKDWRRYTFTCRPSKRYLFVAIGPDLPTDRRVDVDVDDIQLEKGETATDFTPRATVEFGLEPSQPGGIFITGQPAFLVLRVVNHGSASVRARACFTVTDYFDRPVPLAPVEARVLAGRDIERRIPLPTTWRGYFRVRAVFQSPARTEEMTLRLAFAPPRTSSDSVLGINHAFSDGRMISLARKAGVTWYRDWSLKWQDMEPARGEFHWEIADTQIDRVLQSRAHLMALLPPFPSANWSSEAPEGLSSEGYPGVRLRQAWGPKDTAQLASYTGRAVARYRDRVRVWEFLNEPLYTDYALPGENVRSYPGRRYTPADYVRLLKASAVAMRQSDPQCRVMGGIGSGPGHLTSEVMDAGILDAIDIFNLHIYPGALAPEGYIAGMDRFLQAMDAHGGRKPVWVTEFSYYGADDLPRAPFLPAENNWSEERLLRNERECADYTVRFLLVMLSRGVEKVFLHSGANGAVNAPYFECCLFAFGGAPRKAMPALAVFTEIVGPRPECAYTGRLGKTGHVAAFETGRRAVVALWAGADDGPVLRLKTQGVRGMDVMGCARPVERLRLSSSPVYLLGPKGTARRLVKRIRAAVESETVFGNTRRSAASRIGPCAMLIATVSEGLINVKHTRSTL